LFLPKTSPVDTFICGSIVFLIVFVLFRVVPKRQIGELGISDLLVVARVETVSGEAAAKLMNYGGVGTWTWY
jgi:uncharacterized membrane protein YcaP (DUF421 family)